MTLRILHLSDTHFFGDDSLHYGVVDTQQHLRELLSRVEHQRFDLVVCSGDVSEDGSVESYRRVREMLVPWARQRGAETAFAMGNHDDRAHFREVLGGEDIDGAVVSVSDIQGWRVLVLDSSIPGRGDGALSERQRQWLAGQLATPAPSGSIIVVHHPPIPAQTDLLQALALREEDAAALRSLVRDSDVRAILSGHYHLPAFELVDGIPVIVTPGVANIAGSVGDRTTESATDAYGATVIELTEAGIRTLPFIETSPGAREVFHFDRDMVAKIIAAAAPPLD